MHKLLSTVVFVLLFNSSFSQAQCSCKSNLDIKDRISCKPVIFKNKAKLYWQFNCDSTWLTFKNGRHKSLIATYDGPNSQAPYIDYDYAAEYKNVFMIEHRVIMGCCAPNDFILFDKQTGKRITQLAPAVFYSEDPKYPLMVHFKYRDYPTDLWCDPNSLIISNIDTKKTYKIHLPKGRVERSVEAASEPSPEYLFETAVKGNVLTITYRYKTTETGRWHNSKLVIDMSKYLQ